jgi:hypothetical protein
MSDNYLIDSYNLDLFSFTAPKKCNNSMVCKIKNDSNDVLIQFPKMNVVSEENNVVELEFKNEKGYNKKIYDFLAKLDDIIINAVSTHSEEWFSKKIKLTHITQMYNKFIKPPKSVENRCTLNFKIKENTLIDKKNENISTSEIKKGNTLECIAQMKYLVFSKDSCFVTWEICSAKLFKRVNHVGKFGFIDDPEDNYEEPDPEPEDIISFF